MEGRNRGKRKEPIVVSQKQGQSSSVTLVPGQAELCSTWETIGAHAPTKHREETRRGLKVIRSGGRGHAGEAGDGQILRELPIKHRQLEEQPGSCSGHEQWFQTLNLCVEHDTATKSSR